MLNAFAPPFSLVAAYFAAAAAWLLAFAAFCAGGFSLAWLHAFFAGFCLNVITAALLQLASVIFERPLRGVRGFYAAAALQNLGAAGLVAGFFVGDFTLAVAGGAAIFASGAYFCGAFFASFYAAATLAQRLLLCAVALLFFGLLAGCSLAAMGAGLIAADAYEFAFCAHIFCMLGFLLLLSAASASVLLPMFLLAHGTGSGALKLCTFLLFCSALAVVLGFAAPDFRAQIFGNLLDFFALSAYFAAAAFAAFLLYCALAFLRRNRRKIDIYATSLIFAAAASLVSLALFFAADFAIAAAVFLPCALLPFIVAHALKIWPFLVWYRFVAPFAGRQKVPMLADLIAPKFAAAALVLQAFCSAAMLANAHVAASAALFAAALCNFLALAPSAKFINYKGEK